MKKLLYKRKSKFLMYILACFIPVFSDTLINVITSLIIGSITIGTVSHLIKIIFITLGAIILTYLLYVLSRFMRITFMRDTLIDVRLLAFDKIIKLDYKDFSKKSKDSYISNLINDINIFENNFFHKLLNVIYGSGMYVVSLTIILFLDIKYALIVFFGSFILFFISKSFEKQTIKLQEESSTFNENFAVDMSNTFNGLEILKLNNIENIFLKKALKSTNKLESKKIMFNVYTDSQRRVMEFLGFGFLIGSIIYLSNLITQGVSLTQAVLMLQVSTTCILNITSILPLFNQLKSANKIYDKITKCTEKENFKKAKEKQFDFKNEIKICNISFDYDGKKVFNNVSFSIEKGKKYLLKGDSGAGKSTLIKLLSKIYDDYEGQIEIDGVDYKEIKEFSLNDKVAYIS